MGKLLGPVGCGLIIMGPLLALMLYPRANWLFGAVLVGIAILWFLNRAAKDPTPAELADEIEKLLEGRYSGWDVDDFEH